MKNAVIDWETFYDKETSVVTMGTPNYAAAADGYIVSVLVDGEASCGTRQEMLPFLENLAKDPAVRPVAANSNFDQAFTEKYVGPFQQDWFCVLDQAAFHQFPRNMAGLAKCVLGTEMDKSMRDEMRGKRYEDLPASEQVAMQEYCLNDTVVEAEVHEKMAPMSAFEEKVAAHTRMINRRGLCINRELVEADKTKLEAMRFEAFKSIPWHNDYPPLSYPALTRYCGSKGIPVPKSTAKTDEECTDMMSDHPELNRVLGEMRRFRRANTMIKKCEALMTRITDDNILSLDLLFCGAPHTRRWSSKGFNVQNLDKEPLKVTADGQTVWTRNWIVPRPGYTFLILDYAQIEPRCLNWLCGNEEMMTALRAGFSYYEAYARAAKGWKGAPGTIKKELGVVKYTLLKNECLGCGYGMGPDKYTSYANVSIDVAKSVVTGFRATNPKVVGFWKRMDNIIRTAARDKSRHLAVELPSGDLLQHFAIRTNGKGYQSYTTKTDFSHNSMQPRLWGGTLVENLTQRMARDVLATAVVNLEEAGIRVAFHAHDEVILEIPHDSRDEAREVATRIMKTAPAWAADLPLDVEGDWATAYTK